ncbi:MAG: EAL domain-containing protein [Thiolinea sp.]
METLTSEPALPDQHRTWIPDNIKILVIDDEAPLLDFLEQILIHSGYQVIAEKNAHNVVNLAICMQPDVILLDVAMPDIDGFTLCRELKKTSETSHIPIIFLTACNSTHEKITGLDAGGVDYLVKPLDSKELLTRIKKHVEISMVRQSLEKKIKEKEVQLDSLKVKLKKASNFIISTDAPYQKILSALETGIIKVNKDFCCLIANDTAAHLLGYSNPEEMIGEKILATKAHKNKRDSDLRFEQGGFRKKLNKISTQLLTKNNSYLPVEMELTPVNDEDIGDTAIITFNDISVENSTRIDLHSPAYLDSLTGLANRSAFNEIIQRENIQISRLHNKSALFIIDLNYFKEINDSFGHLIGDKVLKETAHRLSSSVREQEKVARLGGDEFGLLLSNFNTTNDLELLAQRLIDKIKQPFIISSASIDLSACIGIAIMDEYLPDINHILNRADLALYKAKEDRPKGFCLFQKEMLDELEDELLLAKELPSLLANDQLYIEYQPQFSITTGQYIGAEALIRWNHPHKGKLLPVSFLPIAEKRGFLRNISNHSLKKVFEQINAWKNQNVHFGKISANICAAQLNDSNFTHEIDTLFRQYSVDPNDLVFEMTESTLFSINKQTKKKLSKLIQLGVKFAIDDFGTGFSSMQLLKDLHSDIMKIDKSFISEIESSEKSRIIIKSIIDLSKNLNMLVIAEGVENETQLKFLEHCGCDSFQGFYQSQSVNATQLEQHFIKA